MAAAAALALSGPVPLTYDEAANYTALASRGLAYAVTHYPTPNNHVAFTALQALLVRPQWIQAWPLLLRIPNLLLVAVLLVLLAHLLRRHAPLSPAGAVLAAAAALICAPLFTTYLLVARGYLAGALLLLGAIAVAGASRPPWITAALLALATWTVPTFGYAAPGVLAVAAWVRNRAGEEKGSRVLRVARDLAAAAAVWGLLVAVLYAPILPEMLTQRTNWRSYAPPGHFTLGIVRRLTNIPGTVAGLVALVTSALAALAAVRRSEAPRRHLMALLIASVASFLVAAEALALARVAPTPFWRNLLFAPLVPPVVVALALPSLSRAGRAVAWTLLLANAGLGAWAAGTSFLAGHPWDYRGFMALSPTPLERALSQGEPLVDARCDSLAEAVCTVYAARLPGLSFGPIEAGALPCFPGTVPPPQGLGITVTVREGRRRLCF
jgi:hypothetical protein